MSPAQKKRQPIFPIIMVAFGILLILGSVAWLVNASRIADAQRASLSSPVTSPRIPYPEVARVSVGDSKAAYDLQQAVFVDTRGEPYFSQGHIPGAISMTEDELSSHLGELDPNAWIITYCTWPAEETSARVARSLIDNGFKKVTPIRGGLEAWLQAGYPVEK